MSDDGGAGQDSAAFGEMLRVQLLGEMVRQSGFSDLNDPNVQGLLAYALANDGETPVAASGSGNLALDDGTATPAGAAPAASPAATATPGGIQARPQTAEAAAEILLRTLWQSGKPGTDGQVTAVFNQRYSSCAGYFSCARKIASLANVGPFYPFITLSNQEGFSNAGIYDQLRSSVQNTVPSTSPLLRGILLLRLDSLQIITRLYSAAALSDVDRMGAVPQLQPEDVAGYHTDLRAIIARYKTNYAALGATQLIQNMSKELKNYVASLPSGGADTPDDQDFNEQTQLLIRALALTVKTVQAVDLYVDRMTAQDPAKWLTSVQAQLQANQLDPTTAFMALTQFSNWEIQLASGADWVAAAAAIQTKSFANDTSRQAIVAGMQSARKEVEAFEDRYAAQMGGFGPFIRSNERDIVNAFPLFQSFRYQILFVTQREAAVQDTINTFADRQHPTAAEGARLMDALDFAETAHMALGCYGYIQRYGPSVDSAMARADVPERLTFPLRQSDSFHPEDVCFKEENQPSKNQFIDSMTQGNVTPETNVDAFLTARNIRAIWAPVYYEVAVDIASLPLMVVSGGASDIAGEAVVRFAAQFAVKVAVESAVRETVVWMSTQALKFVVQVIAFSVVERAQMAVFDNLYALATGDSSHAGFAQLYDPSKSLWANYSGDVLSGAPMMLCLPYVGALSERLAGKFVGASGARLAASALYKGSLVTLTNVAAQDAVFLGLPNIVDQVEYQFTRNKGDPLFKRVTAAGIGQQLLHGTFMTLGFRAFGALHGQSPRQQGDATVSEDETIPQVLAEVDGPAAVAAAAGSAPGLSMPDDTATAAAAGADSGAAAPIDSSGAPTGSSTATGNGTNTGTATGP